MHGKEPGVNRSVLRLRVCHLDFGAALRARTSRDVLMVASPSGHKVRVVNGRDCSRISDYSKLEKV